MEEIPESSVLPLEPANQTKTTRNSRPAPRGSASYQRKRAVTACQVCRARRTKCDNLKPSCSFCIKTGAKCIQSPVDLSSFDPASLKILERLDDLQELLESTSLGSEEERTHKRRAVSNELEPQRALKLQSTVLPQGIQHILVSWPSLQSLSPQDGFLSDSSPGRPLGIPGRSPVSTIATLDLEPLRCKDLLDNFFNHVHVKNPIFDERATRRMVQSTIINGIDWSPESCLYLLICALGSIASPFGPSFDSMPGTPAYASALSFFQAAQKRLGMFLCSDDILAPQCLFLAGVFMMCTFQERNAWQFFIQALAHCQQLSFLSAGSQQRYLDSLNDSTETDEVHTLHQAIYWSSWKSERELRSYLSLPDFSPNDRGLDLYPSFFPTPPTPRAEGTPTDTRRQREQTSWYFYLAEISLRRLAARVEDAIGTMQMAHQNRQAFLHAAASAVPAFEAQVREWTDSLPSSLSFDAPVEEDDVCRFVLRGHAINFYEMIYWPFLSAHLDHLALKPPMLAPFTHLAQAALEQHASRLTVNEPGYKHRHHGTGPMLWTCSRSAAILIATWKHNNFPYAIGHGSGCSLAMPTDWRDSISRVIGTLDYWASEAPEFHRVRHVLRQGLDETALNATTQ